MSVPDPLSVACETRDCSRCDGTAVDRLRDQVAKCTHGCHQPRKGGRA